MKALERYRRKRDFASTPEPAGRKRSEHGALSFVVQKHHASHLHYDLRLEWDGVLKSWAVPKGPSLDPSQKRLAVEVEDHPLEYGSFEGEIPKGQYGAGSVIVWDRGTWIPKEDPRRAHREGRIEFQLDGEKLHGGWTLVRMNGKESNGKTNWLLIKKKDDAAQSTRAGNVLEELPESVLGKRRGGRAGKSATAAKAAAPRAKPARQSSARAKPAPRGSARPKRGRTRSIAWIPPQLATLVDEPPQGDEWIHEIKLDGYRILAELRDGLARLQTRSGQDWTSKFSAIANGVASLRAHSALLDGEIVVLDDRGISRFQALQNAIQGDREDEILYFAFDLLHLDGKDLTDQPLESRKQLLHKLIGRQKKTSPIRWTDHVDGKGARFYEAACTQGLEGIVSKLRQGTYRSGRGRDWLKTKCLHGQELVIVGYSEPSGAREGLGALLLGVRAENGSLRYAGRVGTGFSESSLVDLQKRLRRLERKEPAVDDPPRGASRGVHWVRPELVAQVDFTEWTNEGRLRHPVFRGLREDKPAAEIVRDRASRSAAKRTAKSSPESPANAPVAGVQLTHPERVLYPEGGITKRDLAAYYEAVASRMLPHVADRPLSLVRCPEGQSKSCFFQKHATGRTPDALHPIQIREKKGHGTYFTIDDLAGLVSLVQMGVLEIHLWGCRADRVENPDRVVFDLDPDPSVPWPAVVDGARRVRERLASLDLMSFLKTTGGKGLHVVVPIERRSTWDEAKNFSRAVADELVRESPDLYLTSISKAKRKSKILIDTLRNGRGATWIAPYSTRARPGATVSMPIAWDELSARLHSDAFDVSSAAKRVASQRAAPWKDLELVRQRLPASA